MSMEHLTMEHSVAMQSKTATKSKPVKSRGAEHPLLQMQQFTGNQAMMQMLRAKFIQAKLTVGEPNDIYEQEADRVADQVMRMPDPGIQRQPTPAVAPIANPQIVDSARTRAAGDIGIAYNWSPGWWYSPNSALAGWRQKPLKWEKAQNPPPSGEGIVNWGDGQFTCNIFVYDALYAAGYNPPLHSNKHYYDASETYRQDGALGSYFNRVTDPNQVAPGDIMATGIHMEIVSTPITNNSFQAIGAHSDGSYETNKTYNSSLRFYRLVALGDFPN